MTLARPVVPKISLDPGWKSSEVGCRPSVEKSPSVASSKIVAAADGEAAISATRTSINRIRTLCACPPPNWSISPTTPARSECPTPGQAREIGTGNDAEQTIVSTGSVAGSDSRELAAGRLRVGLVGAGDPAEARGGQVEPARQQPVDPG